MSTHGRAGWLATSRRRGVPSRRDRTSGRGGGSSARLTRALSRRRRARARGKLTVRRPRSARPPGARPRASCALRPPGLALPRRRRPRPVDLGRRPSTTTTTSPRTGASPTVARTVAACREAPPVQLRELPCTPPPAALGPPPPSSASKKRRQPGVGDSYRTDRAGLCRRFSRRAGAPPVVRRSRGKNPRRTKRSVGRPAHRRAPPPRRTAPGARTRKCRSPRPFTPRTSREPGIGQRAAFLRRTRAPTERPSREVGEHLLGPPPLVESLRTIEAQLARRQCRGGSQTLRGAAGVLGDDEDRRSPALASLRVLRSPRLPIGVATTCSTPPMRRWSHVPARSRRS